MGHILIVDDDNNITELLGVNLRSEGYSVDIIECAEQLDRSSLGETRLVIVDAMQQPYSGMDLIFDLKDDPQTEHVGIILYSSFKSERMVIDALDAGADDYIVKPFSLRELIARVKSVLRRHTARPAKGGNIVTFQNLTVDLTTQSVKLDGQPVTLSKIEYSILTLLLKNVDNYVPRIEIHRRVWSDDTAGANERIVDTNISRLRKKLGELGNHIVNRSGHGYMIS
ncbi:MAG: response regulator transcription factor [Muribaculaceae bacterium]|nr:response regulator transcription factor [Muribaculaceae bacterium]MDE6197386.1 response regulator transcription factor [Muribaculaceae bacterium]